MKNGVLSLNKDIKIKPGTILKDGYWPNKILLVLTVNGNGNFRAFKLTDQKKYKHEVGKQFSYSLHTNKYEVIDE